MVMTVCAGDVRFCGCQWAHGGHKHSQPPGNSCTVTFAVAFRANEKWAGLGWKTWQQVE